MTTARPFRRGQDPASHGGQDPGQPPRILSFPVKILAVKIQAKIQATHRNIGQDYRPATAVWRRSAAGGGQFGRRAKRGAHFRRL
jgi:hypothetical protein